MNQFSSMKALPFAIYNSNETGFRIEEYVKEIIV